MARMIYSEATQEKALERAAQELKLPLEALESEILDDNRGQENVGEEEPGVCIRVRVSQAYTAHKALEILRRLLEAMEVDGQVEMRTDKDGINLLVVAAKSSVIIGRDGQTLDSIQHWLTRAVAREVYATPRVFVDVENYRRRKFAKLERMVHGLARKTLQTGEPIRLEPMGPVERKFIHNCLKDVEGVSTFSVGKEGRRSVVISPKEGAEEEPGSRARDYEDEEDEGDERKERAPRPAPEPEDLSDEELLTDESAFSRLRVIATPSGVGGLEDEEIENELDDSFLESRKRPKDEDEDEGEGKDKGEDKHEGGGVKNELAE